MLTDVGVLANIFSSALSLFLGEEEVSWSPSSLSVQEIVSPVLVQCSKAREVNFQFWKLFTVVLDTHIKCVDKVHKRIDPTLVMLPLN